MIRAILMAAGFVMSTVALVWVVGGAMPDDTARSDQVSRATRDAMGLQPAMEPLTAPRPSEPLGEKDTSADLRPVARPSEVAALTPEPAAVTLTTHAVPTTSEQRVNDAMQAMGYGILRELQKPVTAAAQTETIKTARIAAPEPATPVAAAARTYTVQAGDSLPGIAFRHFGTTVAYLQILVANTDVLRTPGELRPGMVLTIPD